MRCLSLMPLLPCGILVLLLNSFYWWATSGKPQHNNECNQIVRNALMFVFPAISSRWCSVTDLLQLHFTQLSFGLLLFTFFMWISSCFSLLRDSCMLIHWITQLTHLLLCLLLVLIMQLWKMLLQTYPSSCSSTRSWTCSKWCIFWV